MMNYLSFAVSIDIEFKNWLHSKEKRGTLLL